MFWSCRLSSPGQCSTVNTRWVEVHTRWLTEYVARAIVTAVSESSVTPSALVAAEIRAELGRQKMNQTELADALDMPINSLRRRLSGETTISVDDLFAIAYHLDVPVTRLLPDRVPAPAVRVAVR